MDDSINLEALFIESEGSPILVKGVETYMVDIINMSSHDMVFKFRFIECNSDWRQGIAVRTSGVFKVESGFETTKPIVFWANDYKLDEPFELNVHSKDKEMLVYNVWEINGNINYWHNQGAMQVESEVNQMRIYHCNDGRPGLRFNDLLFSVEWEE